MPVRCYLPPDAWNRSPARLTGREAHHQAGVLRVREGDRVTCLDGRGRQAEAQVIRASTREVQLRLGHAREIPPPASPITLAAAIPGQGRMDEIVAQATQLGAARVIPLITERTVVRLAPERAARKREHLRQIALEAMKQSGVAHLPGIDPITPWKDVLALFKQHDLVLLAVPEGPHEPLPALLRPGAHRGILLLIGPEGDFSPGEIAQAVAAGAHRFSLGPTVLRCETAVVAALALIAFLLRE